MEPFAEIQHGATESAKPGRSKTARVLNLRLLLGTVLAAAVVVPAAYGWHWHQVRVTASAFLERAAEHEAAGEWLEAARNLHRYLQLHPSDPEAAARLAEVFDRSAADPNGKARACDLYYVALGLAAEEDRPKLRRRVAELQLELGRFDGRRLTSAERETRDLLTADPQDPQANRLLALVLDAQLQSGPADAVLANHASWLEQLVGEAESLKQKGDRSRGEELENAVAEMSSVGGVYQRALRLNPKDITLSLLVSRALRDKPELFGKKQLAADERAKAADEVMEKLVAAQPENGQAYLARFHYRRQYRLEGAELDLQAALRYGDDDPAVHLAAAEHARRQANNDRNNPAYRQACQHYKRAIALAPNLEMAYRELAVMQSMAGETDAALETVLSGLKAASGVFAQVEMNLLAADLLADRGKLDVAKRHLTKAAEAMQVLPLRAGRAVPPAMASAYDLVAAKWLLRQEKPGDATALLRKVLARQTTAGAEASQAYQAAILLAGVHASYGAWDAAAGMYERAAAILPENVQTVVMAAAAWANAGALDRAAAQFERAAQAHPSAEVWAALAGVYLQRLARLPKAQRDWTQFDRALAAASKAPHTGNQKELWRIPLITAEAAVLRGAEAGNLAEARRTAAQILRDAEKQYPPGGDFLAALVPLYQQLGCPDDADRAMAALEQVSGETDRATLVKSRLLVARRQFDEARQLLGKRLESVTGPQSVALRREMAQISLSEGRVEQAYNELKQLQTEVVGPARIPLLVQLAEMADDVGRHEDLQHWEQLLRELEGPSGSYWRYYRAVRLLKQEKTPDSPGFQEAVGLQAEVASLRPDWPAAHLLNAIIQSRRGRAEAAIEAYKQAIRLGDRRVSVFEQLVAALYRSQRIVEAQEYLAQMDEQIPASPVLSGLDISVAATAGQWDRALAAAQRNVQARPDDPMAHVWLGQMLLASADHDEAELAFRRAVELAPTDIRTHNALVAFYARSGQVDRAREALHDLLVKVKLPDEARPAVLAQGYELIGDVEQALAAYREALRLAPENAALQLRMALLLMSIGKTDEAELALRRTLQLDPNAASARRALAALLAARGGESQWREAQQLLMHPSADLEMDKLDDRLQAMLLLRRGGLDNRAKARQLLEKLVANPKTAAPGDRLALAQIYEAEGKPLAARDQMLALVGRENPHPSHLASYIAMLLRHKALDDAQPWLQRLEAAAPDAIEPIALRARWLRAKAEQEAAGKADEAAKAIRAEAARKATQLIEQFGQKTLDRLASLEIGPAHQKLKAQQEAEICIAVGSVLSSLEEHTAAEKWYRRAMQAWPARFEHLALCLAQQGRMEEALQLCRQAPKSGGGQNDALLEQATATAVLLVNGPAKPEHFQAAEPLLAEALSRYGQRPDLLMKVGNVRVVQGRTDEAIELYQRVLRLRPDDAVAMNNLATLYSEQPGKRAEALKYIQQAIQIVGPQAGLRDTEAMVHILDGRPAEAIPLLLEAISLSLPDPDPRHYFHLAVAYERLGQLGEARQALEKARNRELDRQILTPLEKKLLQELEQKLLAHAGR